MSRRIKINIRDMKFKNTIDNSNNQSETSYENDMIVPKFKYENENSKDKTKIKLLSEHELLISKLNIVFENDFMLSEYVANLKFKNMEGKYCSLLTLNNLDEIYNFYFLYKQKGHEIVKNYVDYLVSFFEGKKNTLQNESIFNSPLLKDIKAKDKIKNYLLMRKHTAIEGIRICNNCSSNKLFRETKQLRRADEGMTTVYSCSNCSQIYVEN